MSLPPIKTFTPIMVPIKGSEVAVGGDQDQANSNKLNGNRVNNTNAKPKMSPVSILPSIEERVGKPEIGLEIGLEHGTGSGEDSLQLEPQNRRIACVQCRQHKVKCDSYEMWPAACTKCAKRSVECVLQPDFKRTSKRRKLLEVEREVEILRQAVAGDFKKDGGAAPGPSDRALPFPIGLPSSSNIPPKYDLPSPSYIRDKPSVSVASPDSPATGSWGASATTSTASPEFRNEFKCSSKTMDGVTLSSQTIENLFNEFINKYHPFLPVVDVSRGPEEIYKLCPSLFWTIMAVASRRYDKDGQLMLNLAPLLKNCLAEVTISPITRFVNGDSPTPFLNVASVYTVQAFLIFTLWPPITSSLSSDSSWNSAGIAMFTAIKAGCHCPGYARDFGRVKADNPVYPKISEQIRTWICCNIVSQTVATVFGFPSFTSFDASVLSACEPESGVDISRSIKQMMNIQRLEDEVAKMLNSNPKDPLGLSELSERLSLIQLLSHKLDEVELRIGDVDDIRMMGLLSARVHLFTYYFLDNQDCSELQLQKGTVQTYNSALALLEHAERSYRRNRNFIKCMPGVYILTIWQSSSIINKVVHSPFARYVDRNSGSDKYKSCVQLLSKSSILKHDLSYRAAELMQQSWQLGEILQRRNEGTIKIKTRTRMSASVFFDGLWVLREEVGIRSVAPTILNQRNKEGDDLDNSEESRSQSPSAIQAALDIEAQGSQSRGARSSDQDAKGEQPITDQQNRKPEFKMNGMTNSLDIMLDWDMESVWRDVDLLMTDFGFRNNENGIQY